MPGIRRTRVKYTRSRFINFTWIVIFKTTCRVLCPSLPFFLLFFFSLVSFHFVSDESTSTPTVDANIQWEAFVTFFHSPVVIRVKSINLRTVEDRLSSFFSFSLARRCNSCCPWNWFLAWLVRNVGSMRVFERFDIRLYRWQVFASFLRSCAGNDAW